MIETHLHEVNNNIYKFQIIGKGEINENNKNKKQEEKEGERGNTTDFLLSRMVIGYHGAHIDCCCVLHKHICPSAIGGRNIKEFS